MAVLVQICSVFPGHRMGLDSVLAFQGQVLDSSAVFGTAGPLSHLYAGALGLLLYYRSFYDIICFALMMRLKYLPGQFSVFYLPSISNGAEQLKLGQQVVLRSEKWASKCGLR